MANLPQHSLRVADLATGKPNRFRLQPEQSEMAAIANELGLSGLRKLRFEGEITADGKRDWFLKATIGATVTQPCVVTLDPVVTRIDEKTTRRFVADLPEYADEEDEIEMPEDESIDPLGTEIDVVSVMIETLSLLLPLYPRADGAAIGEANFTEPGQTAMTDEDTKPFAGLAALRDQLKDPD